MRQVPPFRENLLDFLMTLRFGWEQPPVPRHICGQPIRRQLLGTSFSTLLLFGDRLTYVHRRSFPCEPWARRLGPSPPKETLLQGVLPETQAWVGGWWHLVRYVVLSR